MKYLLLTSSALLMSASIAAFAATEPTQSSNPAVNPAAPAPVVGAPANHAVVPAARMNSASNASMSGAAMFTDIPAGDELSSKVIGLEVYNNANQDIGKIKDIAFDQSGVKAYIIAVGGFLGMGDHYVAVQPSAVNLSYDSGNKKWHAAMNTDATQLKAAPEYKYSSND